MKPLKSKRIGIVAIDRSGSRANFPYVIVIVYSDKAGDFERAVQQVAHLIKHEVKKGKDFKRTDYEKSINIILSNNIKFLVYTVDREIYSSLRSVYWRKKWEQKLESVLWFKSCSLLKKKSRIVPSEVFYEKTYSSDTVFDDLFRRLLNDKINLKDVGVGSKYSPYIMVADWLAHFFHASPEIRRTYKSFVVRCETKYIEKILWEILIQKSNTGSRLVGGTAAGPRNDQTINKSFPDDISFSPLPRFKPFTEVTAEICYLREGKR